MSLRERKEVRNAEKARYIELRQKGVDEVSNTAEAAAMRNYRLRNKKHHFPGVAPEEYVDQEPIAIYADPSALLTTAFQRKPAQPVSSTLSETTAQKIQANA